MEIGQSAYDFQLPGVDGKTYSLKDFADKPVLVLFFWCNHCPYVKAYEDRVIQLANEFKDRVAFVAINSNDPTQYPEDSFENMQRIAQEKTTRSRTCSTRLSQLHARTRRPARPNSSCSTRERDLKYHGRLDDNWEHPNQVRHEYVRDAIRCLLENDIPHVSHVPPIGCTIKWKH
jgi:thiol-disulfide isomerase/thioredoxin